MDTLIITGWGWKEYAVAAAIGITRSTIQKHIANLKKAGRLRRVGPDKGGHWAVK